MRFPAGLLPILWLVFLSAPATSAAPQRIASLNLCTDLLLLELVERERIVSLTYWAADPDLSRLADRVGDIPLTLAGMWEHLLAFGELVEEPDRARALADAIDVRLAAVAAQSRGRDRPLAAVYGPQGVSPGRETLMNDLLQLAGYRNLAAEKGIVSYGTLSLESLVAAEPDVLVIDDLTQDRNSIAHHALRHPALARQFRPEQIVSLPPNLTACVGPTVAEAAEQLLLQRPSR